MTISSVLTVNGVAYNQTARKIKSLLVDGFGWDVDGDYWLEFHEVIAGPIPQFNGPYNCSLTVDIGDGFGPQPVFTGELISNQPYFGATGRSWGYRALGLKYLANWIPVTAIDGSGIIRFNVDPTNYMVYTPALTGLTVGQILTYCLNQHTSALSAIGVVIDSTTLSQLAALSLVPNNEVDVQGERLWLAMEAVLQQWARNIRLIILPSGLVRVIDVTAGTGINLVVGTDPVDPPLLSSNWQHAATQMVVRGQGLIEPAYVSTTPSGGIQTLTPRWTTAQANAWNYQDFLNPPGASDIGTCSVTSPTTIQCNSNNHSLSLGTNQWDQVGGWIYLQNPVGSGVTYTEARQITSNTAASGGVFTVTVNYALTGSSYSTYKIIGTGNTLGNNGLIDVYRRYQVTDPGHYIGAHLVRQFPAQVGFAFGGNAAILTNYPMAVVAYEQTVSGSPVFDGASPPMVVDPINGDIVFVRPVVEGGNTVAVLNTGGAGVQVPFDITALLAYSRGALSTTYPTSGYSGTAYSIGGLQRAGYCDVPTWTYFGNSPVLAQLAQMLQQSVGNTIVEGSVSYRGFYKPALNPAPALAVPGYLLSFSAAHYTTGWESLQVPIRAYSVQYQTDGGGLRHTTELRVSTRQDPRTGENYYAHLSTMGSGVFETGLEGSFGGGKMDFGDTHNPHGFQDEQMDTSGFSDSLDIQEGRRGGSKADAKAQVDRNEGNRRLASQNNQPIDRAARAAEIKQANAIKRSNQGNGDPVADAFAAQWHDMNTPAQLTPPNQERDDAMTARTGERQAQQWERNNTPAQTSPANADHDKELSDRTAQRLADQKRRTANPMDRPVDYGGPGPVAGNE